MKRQTAKRPKLAFLHDEIPEHLQEFMHLTRLAEMGRLAASVAHELNNPLMVVQGFAENIELLLEQENLDRDEIRLQVLEIIKSCQRMSRVINKMNRMSRGQKLRLFVVDLAEVALNAVDFMKSQLQDYDVKIDFDFDRPLPIQCDAVQVEQIIVNIISNATFALQNRSDNREIKISFEEVGKWQQLKIWNNGPPIPEEIQTQIMSPFFTTKPAGEGTGLGLAVSKAIMHVHNGALSFKSTPGEGTEFRLSFPRPKINPWKQEARNGLGKVIIIDRQANYRKTLEEKFRLLGFHVESFPDYASGLDAVNKNKSTIAGVMVDIVPGQRECLAFVRHLRQMLGPNRLIFTMSNYPSARDIKGDLKQAGANESFEKPIHADNFAFILKLLDATVLDVVAEKTRRLASQAYLDFAESAFRDTVAARRCGMQQYQDLLSHVLNTGVDKEDRTGTGTLSVFGYQMRFNLQDGFPLVTTKKVHVKSIIHELLWFLKGDTNVNYLKENKVSIWNEWADANGDLGRVYGAQWRHWQAPGGREVDQIADVVKSLKENPNSRRHLVVAFNPGEIDQMALPPCHAFFQFYVARGKLSCQLYQRSADVFLGVPFNIASYALLTQMMAQVCGYVPGEFVHTLGDAHLYRNHLDQARLQLTRTPRELPIMKLNSKVRDIFEFQFEDFELIGYDPHPPIKGEVAI